MYFNGHPTESAGARVYLELSDDTGQIVRAWTEQISDLDREQWPRLQSWVDDEVDRRGIDAPWLGRP